MTKIKNGDLPVTPLVNEHGHPIHASHIAFDNKPLACGMTKREAFAMAAMQGILTGISGAYDESVKYRCRVAVEYADALLAELEK